MVGSNVGSRMLGEVLRVQSRFVLPGRGWVGGEGGVSGWRRGMGGRKSSVLGAMSVDVVMRIVSWSISKVRFAVCMWGGVGEGEGWGRIRIARNMWLLGSWVVLR